MHELISLLESYLDYRPRTTETLREYVTMLCRDQRLTPYHPKILEILERYEDAIYGARDAPPEACQHLRQVIADINAHIKRTQAKAGTTEVRSEAIATKKVESMETTERPTVGEKSHALAATMRTKARASILRSLVSSLRRSPLQALYVGIISAIGFMIRYHLFMVVPLSIDEPHYMLHAFYIFKSLSDLPTFLRYGWSTVFSSGIWFHAHPPLYSLLAGFLFSLKGAPSIFLHRILNLGAGTIAIPLFYLLSKRFYNSHMAGVFSSTYVALNPFLAFWSGGIAKHYSLLLDLTLLSMLFTLEGIRQRSNRNHILAGLFGGLAMLSNTEGIGLIPAIVLFHFYAPIHIRLSTSTLRGWRPKSLEYWTRLRASISSLAPFLLVSFSLYLPFIGTAVVERAYGRPNFINVAIGSLVRPTEVTENIGNIQEVISQRWYFSLGVMPAIAPNLVNYTHSPCLEDVPLILILFFGAAVMCALVKPRLGDKLLLSFLFTFAIPLSLIHYHDLFQFHVPVACMILLCSGFLQRLVQLIPQFLNKLSRIDDGQDRRFPAKRVARYLFWSATILLLVSPNLISVSPEGRSTLNQLLLAPSVTSNDEEIVHYITQNFPGPPVVFVDMTPYHYHAIRLLVIYETNDVFVGRFDPGTGGIHVETSNIVYLESGPVQPRLRVNGPIEKTITGSSLVFLSRHSTNYLSFFNASMNYAKQANMSIVFLRQWQYTVFGRSAPIELYLVSPIA